MRSALINHTTSLAVAASGSNMRIRWEKREMASKEFRMDGRMTINEGI